MKAVRHLGKAERLDDVKRPSMLVPIRGQIALNSTRTWRRSGLRTPKLVVAVVLAVVLGAACSSGGSTAANDTGKVAVEDSTADDAKATGGDTSQDAAETPQGDNAKAQADGAKSDDQGNADAVSKLPQAAVGAAVVTDGGDVFVVDAGPPHWTQAYSTAAQNGARAVAASSSGKMVAYVLDNGSVFARTNGSEGVEPSLVWGVDGGKSPASSLDAHDNTIAIVTADGNVHSLTLEGDSVTDSVAWSADQGAAEKVAAVKTGVFVMHGGKVAFVGNGQAPQELAVDGIVDIDARSTRLVALNGSGAVSTVDVGATDAGASVVWDGSGAASKVNKIALGTNLVMLFEDGTVMRKSPNNGDPAGGARTVWNQVDKGTASQIGSHNKVVLFQIQGGQARWFDVSAPKEEQRGVLFGPNEGQTVASFAS